MSGRRARDPQTNAVLDVRLQCRTTEVQVPLKLDGFLENSQLYIPYFSTFCQHLDRKRKSEATTVALSPAQ
jgi:hypothetical protein